MATRNADSYSLPAIADCTGKEGAFGKQSGIGIIPCNTLGERADCVLGNSPAIGAVADCLPDRGKILTVKIGAVPVAAGVELTPDANGFAITAVSTNVVRCKSVKAGAAGAFINAHWVDAYVKP